MAIPPNPITALVAFLKADTDVANEVSTLVFGAELPQDQNSAMPQKCIVVAGSGGPDNGRSRIRLNKIRIDIKGYGSTLENSWDVFNAAHQALKQMTRTQQGTVLLYDADVAGGPVPLRDNDLDWPMVFGSFNVSIAEIAV